MAPDTTHLLDFPYNGESQHEGLMVSPITPNPTFFVRNHGGIPDIEKDRWFVDVEGLVNHPKRLTLADLQDESKFPRMSTVSTIQCSGTRRIEQISLYPGDGDEVRALLSTSHHKQAANVIDSLSMHPGAKVPLVPPAGQASVSKRSSSIVAVLQQAPSILNYLAQIPITRACRCRTMSSPCPGARSKFMRS